VPRDSSEEAVVAAALADDTTVRFVAEQEIRKRIYVPNRLLNLVVG
jgi:leucyl-tRNA synthetase